MWLTNGYQNTLVIQVLLEVLRMFYLLIPYFILFVSVIPFFLQTCFLRSDLFLYTWLLAHIQNSRESNKISNFEPLWLLTALVVSSVFCSLGKIFVFACMNPLLVKFFPFVQIQKLFGYLMKHSFEDAVDRRKLGF